MSGVGDVDGTTVPLAAEDSAGQRVSGILSEAGAQLDVLVRSAVVDLGDHNLHVLNYSTSIHWRMDLAELGGTCTRCRTSST
jgi:hypothetical protein